MRTCACLLLIAGVAGPVAADELRLTYTRGPDELDFRPPGIADDDHEWDRSERYAIGAWTSYDLLIGFELGLHRAELDEPLFDLDYEAWILRFYSGRVLAATNSFSVELAGYSGVGNAEAELSGIAEASDREWYIEFGAQIGAMMKLGQSFLLGGGVGWNFQQAEFDLEGDRSLDQEGFFFYGSAGVTF